MDPAGASTGPPAQDAETQTPAAAQMPPPSLQEAPQPLDAALLGDITAAAPAEGRPGAGRGQGTAPGTPVVRTREQFMEVGQA